MASTSATPSASPSYTADGGKILFVSCPWLYTADSQDTVIVDGAVLVEHGRFAAVGSRQEVEPLFHARRAEFGGDLCLEIDGRDRFMVPGFVNPHWHETSIRRSIHDTNCTHSDHDDLEGSFAGGGDMAALSALFDAVADIGPGLPPEDAHAAATFALMTQLKSGTTCLGDMGSTNAPEALARAARDVGLRMFVSLWASDCVCEADGRGFRRTRDTDTILASIETLCQTHADPENRLRLRALPSSIYVTNMSDELGAGIRRIIERFDTPWATHVGALRHEAEFVAGCFGRRPIERLDNLGLLNERFLAVHTAFLSPAELDRVAAAGVNVSHSPAKYGASGESTVSETGQLRELAARGLTLSLSSDGDPVALGMMPEAMTAAYLMHNEASASRLAVRPTTALAMATKRSAQVLGVGEELGSVEVGKRADFSLIRTNDWRFVGSRRPLEIFLRLGGCMDIDTVAVEGEVLVRDGRCVHLDEEAVTAAFVAACDAFAARQKP